MTYPNITMHGEKVIYYRNIVDNRIERYINWNQNKKPNHTRLYNAYNPNIAHPYRLNSEWYHDDYIRLNFRKVVYLENNNWVEIK